MVEALSTVDWKLVLPIVIFGWILIIVAIVDWVKQGENIQGNRWVWLFVILFINLLGPILYFIFGRRR